VTTDEKNDGITTQTIQLEDGRLIVIRMNDTGEVFYQIGEVYYKGGPNDLYSIAKQMAARGELLDPREKLSRLEGAAQIETTTQVDPPAFAELVISFLAPKNSVQGMLGDLHEMFQKNADRLGEPQARRKYWMQVANSLRPLIWQWVKRVGFFTVLVDFFRRKLGL
jgi:hypothetical protein